METENWTTLTPAVWKPENHGEQIIGTLISKVPKAEQVSARYYIENNGKTYLLWGSAVLDSRLLFVPIGSRVRITFEGMNKNKSGQDLKMYKVEVATSSSQHQKSADIPASVETIEDFS